MPTVAFGNLIETPLSPRLFKTDEVEGHAQVRALYASLRARIARHYGETYNVDVAPQRAGVTTGSSGGFILSFRGLFDAAVRGAHADPARAVDAAGAHRPGRESVVGTDPAAGPAR